MITSASLVGTRHSKTKKSEPIKKYSPKKDDTSHLGSILAKQTKDLTFEQAAQAKEYHTKEKNQEMIIKCAQRMLAVGGDQELMRTARMELADLFLQKGEYKDAEKYALEYHKYYPGADEAKKASYIAIRSNYLSKLSSDRDQEKTRTTVKLAKEFLTTYKDDTEYTKQINEMLDDCYKSLIRSELNVIETQLNNYHYTHNEASLSAAGKRLSFLKETLLPHAPATEKKISSIEKEIEKLQKKPMPTDDTKKESSSEETTKQDIILAYDSSPQRTYFSRVKDCFYEDNDTFFA